MGVAFWLRVMGVVFWLRGGGGGGVVGVAFRLLKGNGFLVEGSGCGFFWLCYLHVHIHCACVLRIVTMGIIHVCVCDIRKAGRCGCLDAPVGCHSASPPPHLPTFPLHHTPHPILPTPHLLLVII